MTRIVVDPVTLAKLEGVCQTVELCDAAGRVIGHFVPALDRSKHPDMEPRISTEELDRRLQAGGGRPLADILADLEKRHGAG